MQIGEEDDAAVPKSRKPTDRALQWEHPATPGAHFRVVLIIIPEEEGGGVIIKDFWHIFREGFRSWRIHNSTLTAAALAFYSIFSAAPFLIFAVLIASLLFDPARAREETVEAIIRVGGGAFARQIEEILRDAQESEFAGFATAGGVAMLLWGASRIFSRVRTALNLVWNVTPAPSRGLRSGLRVVRNRIASFALVVICGILFFGLLASQAVAAGAEWYLKDRIPAFIRILPVAHAAISFGFATLLFAVIFYYVPDVRILWRDVWFGAAFNAGLFAAASYLMGQYLGKNALSSTYGAAGSLVLFLLWLSFSWQIFLFGAEITRARANLMGRRGTARGDAVVEVANFWYRDDAGAPR